MPKAGKRELNKIDAGWLFHRGDVNIQSGAADCGHFFTGYDEEGHWVSYYIKEPLEGSIDRSEWAETDIPHDWLVEEDFITDRLLAPPRGSSAHPYTGIGCYRKVFCIPEADRGRKISILFDGVFRMSTVWVNGNRMGTHSSGYTSFHYDITDVLRYGDEGNNVIFVRVDATEPEGWWYEGAGIYRHVWLLKTDPLHIARWGTYVSASEISETSAEVTVRISITNDYAIDKDFAVRSTVFNPAGHAVAEVSSPGALSGLEIGEIVQVANVKSPELWSPESPELYRVFTEILCDGVQTDACETAFGIRTLEFTADRGFFLNGKHTPIKGTCNHQDFAGLGVALPNRINEYRVELLKGMGSNAYRTAHHPPTPELLDICDRLGMMVMCENRHLDSSAEGLQDLESMMLRDRNHPCVILWSLENEEKLEGMPMGTRILTTLAERARKLDPTRPVAAAVCQRWNEAGYTDAVDVVGYNYGLYDYSRLKYSDVFDEPGDDAGPQGGGMDVNDHIVHPSRKTVGTETAAFIATRGVYNVDRAKGYYPEYGAVCQASCMPEDAWKEVVKHPELTGVFIWSGFDYRRETKIFTSPSVISCFGAMDLCGFPKDSYYYYKAAWMEEPIVHIFPHWNWPGMEGIPIEVWAYGNCDEVELFLNGMSLGKKALSLKSHITWSVPYEPGRLAAVGSRNGNTVTEHAVVTTGAPAMIRLEPDRDVIPADDAAIVRISVLDKDGNIVPFADNDISFTLEGNGKIIGVGNGDPSSFEPDKPYKNAGIVSGSVLPLIVHEVEPRMMEGYETEKHARRRVFNGRGIVIVQSMGQPGRITVKAASVGLLKAAAEIRID